MANNTFEQNVAQLGSDLAGIKAALEDTHLIDMTGVKPAQYAQKISEIGEWVYPDEWRFDGKTVDEILDEDTEDYPGKAIFLLDNSSNSVTMMGQGLYAYKVNDDSVLINSNLNRGITISLSAKINKLILYFNSQEPPNVNFWQSLSEVTLYAYLAYNESSSLFRDYKKIQFFKFKTGFQPILGGWGASIYNLPSCKITDVTCIYNGNVANEHFVRCPALKNINIAGGITFDSNARSFCAETYSLEKISGVLDMANVSTTSNMFAYSVRLRDVRIKNLKASLSLSTCYSLSRESLIYLINNLQIITSGSQTLTLGTLNINKLTAGEISAGTNKGWVIV